jgi:hypothetical protein
MDQQEGFDGKIVRLRGFLLVALNPRDVGTIALCADENEAKTAMSSHRCFLLSLSRAQLEIVNLKSAWVEITARFTSTPARGRKHIPGLREIRKLEKIPEGHVAP